MNVAPALTDIPVVLSLLSTVPSNNETVPPLILISQLVTLILLIVTSDESEIVNDVEFDNVIESTVTLEVPFIITGLFLNVVLSIEAVVLSVITNKLL